MAFEGRAYKGQSNPILLNGPEQFDDLKVGPSVALKYGPGDYRMWYEAIDTSRDPDGAGVDNLNAIAYATSPDGKTWTKQGVVINPSGGGTWENNEVCPNSLVYDGTQWVLYYHGGNNSQARKIGRATSPTLTNGGTWTKDVSPVLDVGSVGSFDERHVADAKVIRVSASNWLMFYIGRSEPDGLTTVALATSSDGVTWTKQGIVLDKGAGGQWDDKEIMAIGVVEDGDTLRGWYVGRSTGNVDALGYASAPVATPAVWTKGAANPVLSDATGDNITDSCDAFWDGSRIRLHYGRYNLGASPAQRGKGEAYVRVGSRGFNGISTRLDLPDEGDFDFEKTDPFSVSAWIYTPTAAAAGIVCKQQNGGGFPGWNLALSSDGKLACDLRASTGGGAFQRKGTPSVPLNAWTHVAVVYDGSNTVAGIKLFQNGVEIAVSNVDTNLTGSILNNTPVQIGARGGASPQFYFPNGGRISHVAIWNDALTGAEIAEIYEGTLPREDALLALLPLEGNDSPEPDVKGGHDATVIGATFVENEGGSVEYPYLALAVPESVAVSRGLSVGVRLGL